MISALQHQAANLHFFCRSIWSKRDCTLSICNSIFITHSFINHIHHQHRQYLVYILNKCISLFAASRNSFSNNFCVIWYISHDWYFLQHILIRRIFRYGRLGCFGLSESIRFCRRRNRVCHFFCQYFESVCLLCRKRSSG